MNQKHVPDLELCQEFNTLCKEKGIVVPKTLFVWSSQENLVTWKVEYRQFFAVDMRKDIPAPLVSEQGEFLPDELADEHQDFPYFLTAEKRADPDYWIVYYNGARGELSGTQFEGNTEANARMKCLNFLIAEGIITKL